ncbi:hypothetical protein DHEL01_v207795 [Diaporthe helianthi]|uniref:Peptidase S54 rhomboid domain-containing protein n=1 Tax=Diaporthe helianthi TaxID=158607 RepID=A0A2P5HU92_DIAHE|nr:hypothetical protein DHEL01_v207795 [Diaporthe helianthi]
MSTFLGVNCCLRAAPAFRLNLQRQAWTVARSGVGTARFFTWIRMNTRRQGPREHVRILAPSPSQHPWRSSTRRTDQQRTRTFFGSSRVVTNYVDLPPGYEDEQGLPFARQELDLSATVNIFRGSAEMTPSRANKLLSILHGRRVAGSLEDPEVQANTASYTDREISQGLEWLRANVPVDEITNAGLRAEDELRVLESAVESESESEAEANEDSPAGKDANTTAGKSSPWSLYRKSGDDNVYGESIIDKIRARNVARREAEEKALEEKRKQEEEAGQQNWGGLSTETGGARQVAMSAREEAYRAEAMSGLDAPPETPTWRLLLPTTVFVAALAPLLWWASGFYTAPAEDRRLFAPWLTQENATVYGLMLLNLGVFVAWRRMGAWKFLNKHAIMDMVSPRPTGAVAAIFSHQATSHLVENMFVFWLLGGLLLQGGDANRAEYLAVFLGSGAAGFLASLYKCVLTRHLTYGLGASSAIFGVVCCYFWIHRFEGFKILDLPPDPANGIQGLGIIGLIVGLNLIPLFRQLPGQKDWISHLAGIATGIGFATLIEERRESEKKDEGQILEGKIAGT